MKNLAALLTVIAVGLVATDSFAWFQICNKRQVGGWVSYTHYISKEQRIDYECGFSTIQGTGCYYSAWKSDGWWYLSPNQCATVWSAAINNRFHYVHADWDDGAVTGSGFSFYIQDPEFHWDSQQVRHGSNCVVGQGIVDCQNRVGYWTDFSQVDSGSNSNFTDNLTN